jgi:cell division protein FtsL
MSADQTGAPRGRLLAILVLPLLWLGVLASAAGAIYCKHVARARFVELEALTAQRDALQIEWGRLQLEQSAWSTHGFVERVAGTRLKMTIPPPAGVQIVRP